MAPTNGAERREWMGMGELGSCINGSFPHSLRLAPLKWPTYFLGKNDGKTHGMKKGLWDYIQSHFLLKMIMVDIGERTEGGTG